MVVVDVLLGLNLLAMVVLASSRRALTRGPAGVDDDVVVPFRRPDIDAIEAAKALHPAFADRSLPAARQR